MFEKNIPLKDINIRNYACGHLYTSKTIAFMLI